MGKSRFVTVGVVVAVFLIGAAAFTYQEYELGLDRESSRAACESIHVGTTTGEALTLISKTKEVRFADLAAGVVAIRGPAYCYCRITPNSGGLVLEVKSLCQH